MKRILLKDLGASFLMNFLLRTEAAEQKLAANAFYRSNRLG
jgi:hypothetical protein